MDDQLKLACEKTVTMKKELCQPVTQTTRIPHFMVSLTEATWDKMNLQLHDKPEQQAKTIQNLEEKNQELLDIHHQWFLGTVSSHLMNRMAVKSAQIHSFGGLSPSLRGPMRTRRVYSAQ